MEVFLTEKDQRSMQEILKISNSVKDCNLALLTYYKNTRFEIVAKIGHYYENTHQKYYRAIEVVLLIPEKLKILINYYAKSEIENSSYEDLVRITKLNLCPVRLGNELSLNLAETCQTKIFKLVPDIIIGKNFTPTDISIEKCLSTPKSRRITEYCVEHVQNNESISKIITMNLIKYAENTPVGLRFPLKTLLTIADKVNFAGIIIKINSSDRSWGNTFIIKCRDLMTNDTINIFVSYSSLKFDHVQHLSSLNLYDVILVSGKRMVFSI